LITAIELDRQKVVDHLLTQWAPDVTMKQSNGQTALMAAVESSDGRLTVQLLNLGADINAPLNDGISPLMRAVQNGSYELVDILLKSGADPNLKNSNETVFSIAKDRNDEKILQLLKKVKS
jgi:serine/threonine-protein phosphatase 6 regulatory ankyrin repeat subunit B